jgi:hypothetical protein
MWRVRVHAEGVSDAVEDLISKEGKDQEIFISTVYS